MEALHRSLEVAADGVPAFVKARSRMLAVAYRTLGNAADAEDIVQDVWLRWQNVNRDGVRNAPAFLTTATLRLAINRATEAHTRHDTPLELWFGEPVDPSTGPGKLAERGQALEAGLLLLLETLAPMELAAYLLREAFDYSYRQIAQVIGGSEANSRQLVTRARKHLGECRRVPSDTTQLRRLSGAFIEASQQGDLAGLEAVLSASIADSLASRAGSCARARAGRRCHARCSQRSLPRKIRGAKSRRSLHV